MKTLRLPTATGGDIWVAVHDLMLMDGIRRRLRPVHVFTHLAQGLVTTNRPKMYSLCMALENKLYSVHYSLFEVKKSIAVWDDPIYSRNYVREYEGPQRVVAAIESYLNSIYTVLEIVSHVNRLIHPGLRIGFRKQSKKSIFFSFAKWDWLPHFYDIRTELSHFGTTLPIITENIIIIEFNNDKDLEIFNKGRYNINLAVILNYCNALYDMLDAWAMEEMKSIDPNFEINIFYELGPNSPLKQKTTNARNILKLLKDPRRKKARP